MDDHLLSNIAKLKKKKKKTLGWLVHNLVLNLIKTSVAHVVCPSVDRTIAPNAKSL